MSKFDLSLNKSAVVEVIINVCDRSKDTKGSKEYFESIENQLEVLSFFFGIENRLDCFVLAHLIYFYHKGENFAISYTNHLGISFLEILNIAGSVVRLAMSGHIRLMEDIVDYYEKNHEYSIFLNNPFYISDVLITNIAFEKQTNFKLNVRNTTEFVGLINIMQFRTLDQIILKNFKNIDTDLKIDHYNTDQRYLLFTMLFEYLFKEKYKCFDISKRIELIDVNPLIDDLIIMGNTSDLLFTDDFLSRIKKERFI